MSQIEESLNRSYLEKFKYLAAKSSQESQKHTILVVDDEKDNIDLLKRTLRQNYIIITASNGQEALEMVEKYGKDISAIISDQKMPVMTGTEFLAQTTEKYPYIVKMLLTGYTDIDAMIDGVNKCNLFQYITKPFDIEELKLITKNAINVYELTLSKNALLQDLKELFFTTVKSISSALDAKDTYTHGHSYRVTLYSLILAKELNLPEELLEEIETAGLLHDIGKIGVPEYILCKPGKLTDEEYGIIKLHPERGKKILNGIRQLKDITVWVNSHHERWDGRGYPEGLKESEIPYPARILAIADTYDAMTSNRSYRKGLSHEIAYEEIKKCAGSQFDPELVKAFINVEGIFNEANINPDALYKKYSVINKIFQNNDSQFL